MKINSRNEWGKLKSVVVGTANYANWPTNDPVFNTEMKNAPWKDTPPPSGPVPQWIIDETNEDLEELVKVLKQAHVEVHRPTDMDFRASDGMYNYCPRDRLLIVDDTVVDVTMMYPVRDPEICALGHLLDDAKLIHMPKKSGLTLDAANICRINDTLLYLLSSSGNQAAANWLQEQLPNKTVTTCNFYSGVHIDSTISVLQEGFVVLNASRVTLTNIPDVFRTWDQLWVEEDDIVPQDFYQYPYASKWIALNMFSIDPQTVIVDKAQTKLIKRLEENKFTVVPLQLRHSRTLGGGFHCVTLDLERE